MGRGQPGSGIVVIGASAGGVEALRTVVRTLPTDLPAAVFVALHLPPTGAHHPLAEILNRVGPLPADTASDGAPVISGRIVVAPAQRHLILAGGRMHLSSRPPHNGHRPSLDVLLRSAAREYGPAVVGVVLSGDGDDGAAGLVTVVRLGGAAIVQDPAEAEHPSMPRLAHIAVPDALTCPAGKIGVVVSDLISRLASPAHRPEPPGLRAPAEAWGDLEAALSLALGALEERSLVSTRMALSRRAHGNEETARRYEERAEESEWAAAVIRQWVGHRNASAGTPVNPTPV